LESIGAPFFGLRLEPVEPGQLAVLLRQVPVLLVRVTVDRANSALESDIDRKTVGLAGDTFEEQPCGQASISGVVFCGPNPFTGFGPDQGVFGLIQGTPRVALGGVLAPELFGINPRFLAIGSLCCSGFNRFGIDELAKACFERRLSQAAVDVARFGRDDKNSRTQLAMTKGRNWI
jgi:hypothetical protein